MIRITLIFFVASLLAYFGLPHMSAYQWFGAWLVALVTIAGLRV